VAGKLRNLISGRHSVSDDWTGSLSPAKNELFECAVRRWETGNAMLSVALSEAFSCRSQSALVAARQHASVAADLAGGLAANLAKALQYLHGFACALSGLPSGNPLNPEFYRSETARHAAEWHSVRHGILLRDRSRFLHKLGTLARITQSVAHEFDETARDISDGTSTEPDSSWTSLNHLHYDLNTCLREAIVLFKSILHATPDHAVPALQSILDALASPVADHTDEFPLIPY
jgi:hypothetical protein